MAGSHEQHQPANGARDDRGTRLCAGCRQHDERTALLRLVLAGDPPRAVPDVARGARGRGVSVHATRRCLQAAVRSGAVRRGLRSAVDSSADELAGWASGQYTRRIEGLLIAAQRSGAAAIGSERVRDAIAQRRVALLVLANDAGEGQQELQGAAERLGGRCMLFGDKAALGRLYGRELVAVVAITDTTIAQALRSAADCIAELGAPANFELASEAS
jgi:predicted RNA-binding protein YlxR (DUF448 family)/ribosomal protein L7Ae-like RNA K-turn-binding protein